MSKHQKAVTHFLDRAERAEARARLLEPMSLPSPAIPNGAVDATPSTDSLNASPIALSTDVEWPGPNGKEALEGRDPFNLDAAATTSQVSLQPIRAYIQPTNKRDMTLPNVVRSSLPRPCLFCYNSEYRPRRFLLTGRCNTPTHITCRLALSSISASIQ